MKVLQLCSKVPFPAKDGGCLAMLNLTELLYNNHFEVKLLAIETHKHPAPIDGYAKDFKNKYHPESVFIDTKANLFQAASNLLFSKQSYHLSRFYNSNFKQKLVSILNIYKPDIVILDSLFTCGYIDDIKSNSGAKIVYRAHNVEHIIWQEIAMKTKSFFKNNYLKIQSKRLKNEELKLIQKCDGIISITEKDHTFFKRHFTEKKTMTLPFTVDIDAYDDNNDFHQKSLFFIGAMDWYPNLEGVKWFIDMVWNKILQQHPTAKFYIAGKAMPDELKNMEGKNIVNLGEVADAKKFMGNYPIMVAPIFSGGGLKIKIVEAMAMGKIVICNPEAANGIPITDKQNILLASSSSSFIEAINHCFNKMSDQIFIGENARNLIETNFSSKFKGQELELFLKTICTSTH
jgi:glycosyltransferase involved in cell wall biosynthesis